MNHDRKICFGKIVDKSFLSKKITKVLELALETPVLCLGYKNVCKPCIVSSGYRGLRVKLAIEAIMKGFEPLLRSTDNRLTDI